jgi:serine/threonine protein phosphatase 1
MTVAPYPTFERHAANRHGRTFVAGDIHGQYDALMTALHRVGFDRDRDILYQVGDLIDRGKDSFQCLSLAFEPWFRGVLGNHEQLAIDALREGGGHVWDLWFANGGSWAYLEDVREVRSILEEALRYLPLAREFSVGDYRFGLVHAEPPWDWQQVALNAGALKERLTWGRTRTKQQDTSWVEGVDAVLVGHTIVDTPQWLGNVLHLDTGAFRKEGSLTLLALDDLISGAYPEIGFPPALQPSRQ